MKRVLKFDGPKAAMRFDLLRAALASAGDGKAERGPVVIRKEARLADALDEVSEATNPQDADARTLKASENGDLRVTLAQEDFELLQQYTEKVAWNPRHSRSVVDLWDWLSAAERLD